jgi:cytochrome c peroxidase
MHRLLALVAAFVLLGAWPSSADALRDAFLRPAAIPFPAGNPFSEEKRALGERLFFDPILSGGDTMSCAGCHAPGTQFTDARPLAVGEAGRSVGMRSMTLWNSAWSERLFWDGRVASLEEQAPRPITAPDEMRQDLAGLMAELDAAPGYRDAFARAFPEEPRPTPRTLAAALATFERTLVAPEAPFDRWLAGDAEAMGEGARRGFNLFTGKAGCVACHEGWAFTDHAFHDNGLPSPGPGRGGVLGIPALANAWKTPTLRQLKGRAPYMHDGSVATLADVVRHYAEGVVDRPTLSPDLRRRLELDEGERADLVAFLEALHGDGPPLATASAPRPGPAPPPGHRPEGAPAKAVEVTQKDKAFSAARVHLARGGALIVHNEDTREHNVRVFSEGMDYDSGLQGPGQSVTLRFDEAGTHRAYCAIHPKMRLTVEVEP